jgi:hypothetical protein
MGSKKRHNGIVKTSRWATCFQIYLAAAIVDLRRQVPDLLEESRVNGLKVTLAQHIMIPWKGNIDVQSRTSKRAPELEDDKRDGGV